MNGEFNADRERRLDDAIARLPREMQPPAAVWEGVSARIRGAASSAGATDGVATGAHRSLRVGVATFAAAAAVLIVVLVNRGALRKSVPASELVQTATAKKANEASKLANAPTALRALRTPIPARTVERSQLRTELRHAPKAVLLEGRTHLVALTPTRFEAHPVTAIPIAISGPAQPVRVSTESGVDTTTGPAFEIVLKGRAVVLRPSNPNITVILFY